MRLRLWAALLLAGMLLLVAGTPAHAARSLEKVSGASASGSYTDYGGSSADGRHVIFVTSKQLDPADTDSQVDVYDNFNGVNTLVSIGTNGGNGAFPASFDFVSQDGATVVFETSEQLTPLDTDNARDVFTRTGITTTMVSKGPSGTSAPYDGFYEGASADASKIFFGTNESLVPTDTDTSFDSYMRGSGTTTLITTGPNGGNGSFAAEFAGASQDGTHAFFQTAESLVSSDTDSQVDVYERVGSTTNLLSTGPNGGNGSFPATYRGTSTDGTKVFFSTDESLDSADAGAEDIYKRAGGVTSIMSNASVPGAEEYVGNSSDGSHVYFQTQAKETADDPDNFIDVYDSLDGSLTLVSPGLRDGLGASNAYFVGASSDGTHIFIRSEESLAAADTDNTQDLYDVSGGAATLMSVGPAGGNASASAIYAANSQDGSRFFFTTYESLVPQDTDAQVDVYERTGGTTTLLTAGTTGGNGAVEARFRGITADGSRVFFGTDEPLVAGDTDALTDIYASSLPGQVVIVKNAVPDDPQDFTFTIGGGLSLGLQAPPGATTFQLDDDGDPALSNTQTFAGVATGSGYSVAETVPTGWDQASATCNNGSPVNNIRVDAGATTTCTFTNNKRGKVVVVKDAIPNAPRDFFFTAGGGLSPTSFQLDDDSDPTLSNTHTFDNVLPGSGYTLAEQNPSPWTQQSATCDNGSPVTNISVATGQTVTCTFVNTNRSAIVVVEDSQPNDPQDFSYSTSGGLVPSSFQLDDDSDPALANTTTFSGLDAGTYSINQSSVSGWDLASSSCSDGSPANDINLSTNELVTCTFVNKKPGNLVVVEDSLPDDPQDFSFAAGGGLSPSSFQLDDDANPTLSNTRTFSNIQAKNGYSLAETVPGGWALSSATCSDGSPIANVDVGPAETVTCTFLNSKRATITVVKDAQPNDAQDFSFSATGGLSPTGFQLDDDSDGTLSNQQIFSNVAPGSGYGVSETVPSGWTQSSATCSDGSPVSNINASPGEQITCTFVNKKRGSITIVKDAQPNDPQDFSFTAGGGLSPTSFQLDDDSDGTLSNTRTFANVPAAAGYSVAETPVSGWTPSSSCSDGSPVSNIDVAPGENVTCTFTNQRAGTIVALLDSQPNDAQDFSFTAGGGLSPTSFQLDDDSDGTLSNSQTFGNLTPRAGYTLSGSVPSGWDQLSATCNDGSPVSNIDVAPGETVTCTFTNRKRGSIVVVEDSLPNDPQDFSFTADPPLSPSSFDLDDDSDPALSNTRTFSNVVPASGYTIDETVPSGWDQTTATCSNGSPISNITVAAGQTVTCTVTNRKRGKIVVVKDAQPNDPQDFSFSAAGGLSPSSFDLDDDSDPTLSNTRTFDQVVPGSGYSVDELLPGSWDQDSATCSDGSPPENIGVSAGETVTCTFVNTKLAHLTIVKDAVPNDAQDFSFTASSLVPSSFQLDDDSNPALSNTQTFPYVSPGTYAVNEGALAGWDVTGTCSDGSPTFAINLSAGEQVTCTFTNRRQGSLTVVEQSNPNDPQDFSFTASGGLSPSSFSLDDDSDPTLADTRTFSHVSSGVYGLNQAVPGGWDLTNSSCDDGSAISAIDISPGENVTCTFSNRKRGKIVVTEDAQPNDPQDFSFTAGGGLSPASFQLDDDSDGTLSNSRAFNDLAPGSGYSIAQTLPSGWDLGSATCDDGSPPANVDVAAGETVTCTFTNVKRGKVVVVKNAVPNDPQDFSFSAGGGLSPTSFQLDDDSNPALPNTYTFNNVVPGSGYSVDETVPSGWDQSSATCSDGSPISNIDVGAGETVTCTFVNTARAQLTIKKDAQPNDPQDFSFTTTGGLSPSSFQLDDDSDGALSDTKTFANIAPGTYSAAESAVPGWDLSGATCDDGSPVSAIDVSAGENVTCTFTNRQRGSIVVVEDSVPDDPQDFTFTAGGGLSPASFQLDDDADGALSNTRTFNNVVPGSSYSLNETQPSGWSIDSATCDDGSPISAIDVAPGETVTCTFTNNQAGKIVAVKDAQPNDPQDFSFTAGGGLSPAGFQLDDDADGTLPNQHTFSDLTPSSGYSLSESVPAGWDQTGASCDDGSPVSNIDVAPAETVTCTFTNRKRGKIVVVKDAIPNDPQDFSFTAGGGLSPANFQLDDDSDGTLSNTRTFTNVVPGSGYSVSELLTPGWSQTSATCSDGSPLTNIDVGAGETVTCTFVNTHGYPRPRGATPFRASLVPAYSPCASPNSSHGAPLSSPSCEPPVPASSYLTVGSPDSNGRGANMNGSLLASVMQGNPATPEDEADVDLTFSVTDVRNQSDLSDYTGGVLALVTLRATDRYNGASLDDPATTMDFPFSFTVPCTITASTSVGSTCAVTTTADAITLGAVVESKRTIWQLGEVDVFDGGADGNPSTAPNTLFATQGVFVP
jgi:prealbumin domain-containing protein